MADALSTLKERLAEIHDLSRSAGVLGWDQRVTMPPLGTDARAEALATLSRIAHERFVDPEIGRLLDELAPLGESLPYDSDDASLIRVTRRDWEKARRVPAELEVEMTRAAARGHQAWVEARRDDDFESFLPYLRTNVELKRRYVGCFEWSDSPYTPLLDDYEPGMETAEVVRAQARRRRSAAGSGRASSRRARGRRAFPPRHVSRRPPAGIRRSRAADARLRGRLVATGSDGSKRAVWKR